MIIRFLYVLLKTYVNFCLHSFFKNVVVKGQDNIPREGPLLFLANHQNALLDALLIVTQNRRKTYFVARADVFKKPWIKRLLAHLNMMPIYRIRDGREALKLNDKIFEACARVLGQGDCLVVFPEGNHSLKRRLRPLSKGFTRIIEHTYKSNPNLDLKIIPVGLNYTDHQYYRGSTSILFGAPINVQDFGLTSLKENQLTLRKEVSNRLKELIIHIEDESNYESIATALATQNPDYLHPEKTNLIISQLKPAVDDIQAKETTGNLFKKVATFPLLINSILPLSIWWLIRKGIKDPVMIGTIKFATGITVFPTLYFLQFLLVSILFNYWIGLVYISISIMTLPLLAKH